ncbi:hypothetical protein AB5N19_09919 [Seiridium cardinale]
MTHICNLPPELQLMMLDRCGPSGILSLISASSTYFRVFQSYRHGVIKAIIKKMNARSRPSFALIIADIRLRVAKLQSSEPIEIARALNPILVGLPSIHYTGCIGEHDWPQHLVILAALGELFSEVDIVIQEQASDNFRETMKRNTTATSDGLTEGYKTVPPSVELTNFEHRNMQDSYLAFELHFQLFRVGKISVVSHYSPYEHTFINWIMRSPAQNGASGIVADHCFIAFLSITAQHRRILKEVSDAIEVDGLAPSKYDRSEVSQNTQEPEYEGGEKIPFNPDGTRAAGVGAEDSDVEGGAD